MWKYCRRISELGFFIFYIIFYSFISFSSTHVSPIPLLLFLFLLQNLPTTSFALLISEKRETETKREEKDWGIGVHHAVGDQGSPCRRRSTFTMHYHVRRPTPAHPPPHHQAGSDRLVLFFLISYLLGMIQLYFIRIGICFVLCVWIMWEIGLDRLVLFFFFSYLLVLWEATERERQRERERVWGKKEIQRREKELIKKKKDLESLLEHEQ